MNVDQSSKAFRENYIQTATIVQMVRRRIERSRDVMHPAERAPRAVSPEVANANPVSLARSGESVASEVAAVTDSASRGRVQDFLLHMCGTKT